MRSLMVLLCFFVALANANALDASVQFARFYLAQQPYVECYMHFTGRSLSFKPLVEGGNEKQSSVEVTILFRQGDTIAHADKLLIRSPVSEKSIDFVDQQRYPLAVGNYMVEVLIKDLNDTTNVFYISEPLELVAKSELMTVSDIQFLQHIHRDSAGNEGGFFKNGYFMESLSYDFANKSMSELPFYVEVYPSKSQAEDFLVTTAITPSEGGDQRAAVWITHKRVKAAPVVPLMLKADISTLPSGNYQMSVVVRDRNQNKLAESVSSFQRSNPYLNFTIDSLTPEDLQASFVDDMSIDSLKYSLRAIAMQLSPIDGQVIKTLSDSVDVFAMRQYLLSYWLGVSPNHPDIAYNQYMQVARAIDLKYANGFGYGFESDRGWMFMKYGRPSDLTAVETDPSAPPYEIWTYYTLEKTNQRNVRFVFYNPSLVANGHQLLHSTARGERNNPRWQVVLYGNAPNEMQGSTMDATQMQDNWGRNAGRLYNDQ